MFSSILSKTEIHFFLDKKGISELPAWGGEGSVPLCSDAATALATKKHKDEFGKAKLRSISLKSKKTRSDRSLSCPEKVWYYKVKVKGDKKRTYAILMNDSFVEPRIIEK